MIRTEPEDSENDHFHDCQEEPGGTQTIRSKNQIGSLRSFCGDIVNHKHFSRTILLLIVINAILMGIETFDFVRNNKELKNTFRTIDKVFLGIFTVELILQFIYLRFSLFKDGWLVFDLFIVVSTLSMQGGVQVVRAFRIFRAFRVVSRIEVLRDLVVAILSLAPRMAAICGLMFLMFYIFAVLFTTLFKNESEYFARLDSSLFTLFQIMTLEDWSDIARDLMEVKSWAWLPIISFVTISSFIMYNLIIAVICDAVLVLHQNKKKKKIGLENTDEAAKRNDEVNINVVLDDLSAKLKEFSNHQEKIHSRISDLAVLLREDES